MGGAGLRQPDPYRRDACLSRYAGRRGESPCLSLGRAHGAIRSCTQLSTTRRAGCCSTATSATTRSSTSGTVDAQCTSSG
jgi:hypothetical protein